MKPVGKFLVGFLMLPALLGGCQPTPKFSVGDCIQFDAKRNPQYGILNAFFYYRITEVGDEYALNIINKGDGTVDTDTYKIRRVDKLMVRTSCKD